MKNKNILAAISTLLASATMLLVINLSGQNGTVGVDYEKVTETDLGKMMFNDTSLSANGKLSCASCHNSETYFQDGLDRGLANGSFLRRNTPTLLNVSFYKSYFWDGKSKTLEDQMNGPLFSKAEMGASEDGLEKKIEISATYSHYYGEYRKIYPDSKPSDFIKKYIIKYISSIQTTETEWSQRERAPLPNAAYRGYEIFTGKGKCSGCHSGAHFTDNGYHDNGLYRRKTTLQGVFEGSVLLRREATHDVGRGDVEPGLESLFKFRTPSLINVSLTGPYMHDGSIPTLEGVVDFYSRGGDEKDSGLPALKLSEGEKSDLVIFLYTLSDIRYRGKK